MANLEEILQNKSKIYISINESCIPIRLNRKKVSYGIRRIYQNIQPLQGKNLML